MQRLCHSRTCTYFLRRVCANIKQQQSIHIFSTKSLCKDYTTAESVHISYRKYVKRLRYSRKCTYFLRRVCTKITPQQKMHIFPMESLCKDDATANHAHISYTECVQRFYHRRACTYFLQRVCIKITPQHSIHIFPMESQSVQTLCQSREYTYFLHRVCAKMTPQQIMHIFPTENMCKDLTTAEHAHISYKEYVQRLHHSIACTYFLWRVCLNITPQQSMHTFPTESLCKD